MSFRGAQIHIESTGTLFSTRLSILVHILANKISDIASNQE